MVIIYIFLLQDTGALKKTVICNDRVISSQEFGLSKVGLWANESRSLLSPNSERA